MSELITLSEEPIINNYKIPVLIPYNKLIKTFDKYALKRIFNFDTPIEISNNHKTPIIYSGVYIYTFVIVNLTPSETEESKIKTTVITRNNITNLSFIEDFYQYLKSLNDNSENKDKANIGKIRKKFYEVVNIYVPIFSLPEDSYGNKEENSPEEIYEIYFQSYIKSAKFGSSKIFSQLFKNLSEYSINIIRYSQTKVKSLLLKNPTSFTFKGLKLINTFLNKEFFKERVYYENFKTFEECLPYYYHESYLKARKHFDATHYSIYREKPNSPFYFLYSFIGEKKNVATYIHIDGKAKEYVLKYNARKEKLYDFYYRGYSYLIIWFFLSL